MQSLEYTDQIQQLVERGFTDRDANLDALIAKKGNVDTAARFLLREFPNLIGEGRSGKVFFPALPCTDNRFIPPNYVSKLVTEKIADKELKEAVKAEQYLPDDALYVLDTCQSSIKDQMRNKLVFSRYGGNNLVNLLYYELYDGSFDEVERDFSPNILKYKKILISLQYLREKVLKMNKEGFYHNDISPENIVYNEEEAKSYLIDFESASNTPVFGRNNTIPDDIQTMDDIIHQLSAFITKLDSEMNKYDNPKNTNLYSDDFDYPYPGIFQARGIKSKKKRKTRKTITTRKTRKMRKTKKAIKKK